MITVLSLNTAIDRIMLVSGFQVNRVFRAERVLAYAGGKGLNVARALRRLEESVQVIGFLGGSPTEFIKERCEALGIEQRWVQVEGESRTCLIVVDPQSHDQTVVNEPGPEIACHDLERLCAVLRESTKQGDILCISGSTPPGVPDDLYRQIVQDLQTRGIRVLADVSGAILRRTLEAHPWAVAPNADETAAALSSHDDPAYLADRLAQYAEHALLTLGKRGVIYAHDGQAWELAPPEIKTVNAVGSGDAFAAGFLTGIDRGMEPLEATKLGVACGASNARRLEPEIGPREEIERLAERVRVKQLSPL